MIKVVMSILNRKLRSTWYFYKMQPTVIWKRNIIFTCTNTVVAQFQLLKHTGLILLNFIFFFNYPHRSNQATKYSTDTDYQISLIFLNADFKKPTIFNDVMGYHNKNQHEIMLINQHRFSWKYFSMSATTSLWNMFWKSHMT